MRIKLLIYDEHTKERLAIQIDKACYFDARGLFAVWTAYYPMTEVFTRWELRPIRYENYTFERLLK
jgi:hypothetical protein